LGRREERLPWLSLRPVVRTLGDPAALAPSHVGAAGDSSSHTTRSWTLGFWDLDEHWKVKKGVEGWSRALEDRRHAFLCRRSCPQLAKNPDYTQNPCAGDARGDPGGVVTFFQKRGFFNSHGILRQQCWKHVHCCLSALPVPPEIQKPEGTDGEQQFRPTLQD
jgi:hypothetical protein